MADDPIDLLDEVEAALAESTPGPWSRTGPPDDVRVCATPAGGACERCIAISLSGTADGYGWTRKTMARWRNDAHLIASAPTWLRALVDRVRMAEAERDGWRARAARAEGFGDAEED